MPTPSNQRDIEIQLASNISKLTQSERDFFILTGSYSIDALTGADVTHNDIDANVFTNDIPTALNRVVSRLSTHIDHMHLVTQADDRLEYIYPHSYGQTQVEMQFVEYSNVRQRGASRDFSLPNNTKHSVAVPTVSANLRTTDKREHFFTVKSLPFAIGTWALRISGVALDQKREVRKSDLRHFAFLVAAPHDRLETLRALRHHPQMPDDYEAEDVLAMSCEVLSRSANV